MNESVVPKIYTDELNRVLAFRRAMDTTRNLSVLVVAGMAYVAFGLPQTSSHLVLILGSLIVFLFQLFETRTSQFAETSEDLVRNIEKNFLAPSVDSSIGAVDGWEQQIAESLSEFKLSVGFLDAFAERVFKSYFLIFLTLDLCWFSKLYLFPEPASTWTDFVQRLDFGVVPGGAFIVFAGAFWIAYLTLAAVFVIKNKGSEIRY